jgi:FtsP/CotA-like multicopper oxidase with cupredoxin domain
MPERKLPPTLASLAAPLRAGQSLGAARRDWPRRDFLKLGVSVTAGMIVPPVLSACGGGGDGESPVPPETFVEPLTIASKNGVLDVTLVLSYLTTTLYGTTCTLRNMFGTIPAPTLRVNVGDVLRIKVFNNLPPNPQFPPNMAPPQPAHLKYPNSTNLHTHGLHVYPDIIREPTPTDPGLYGDFVMDDPNMGIQPGETRQYEYRLRTDHPAGMFWYHPHLHGSSAMQVGSGMAGALVVEGPIDDVPQVAAAQERIFMFQAPIFNSSGQLQTFTDVASVTTNEPPFLINGVRRPRIVMKTGEVQNWRFCNAAIFNMLNLSLDRHTLHEYSHDGYARPFMRPVPPIPESAANPPNNPPPASYPEGIVLGAGNRTSVLVKAGAPGTYYLRTMPIEVGRNAQGQAAPVLNADILAEVVVVDDPKPMSLPPEPLPVTPFLAPITDEELAAHGGLKRTIVMRVIASDPPPPPPPAPPVPPFTGPAETPLVQPPPGELPDWVYQAGPTQIANKVFAIGTVDTTSSANPAYPPATYIPFQSSKALTQTVALNAVEEWTIVNMNNVRHPFHIHVNPVYIVAINGVKLADPYWADTIPMPASNSQPTPPGPAPTQPGATTTTVTFRTRFLHYTGRYVMHCHMLVHEDMGMMQGVTVVG